ncbi:MAG TPA: prolyl oligopeptidase family serine peptidase [Vicinamibacteria bacterium]
MNRRTLALIAALGAARAETADRPITVADLLTVSSPTIGFGSPQVQISPDGKRIVYQLRRTLLEENRYVFDLWLIDAAGGAPRQLTHLEPTTGAVRWLTPRWSPDSRRIAYFAPRGGRNQIALLNPDDGNEELLTQDEQVRAGFDPRIVGTVSEFKWSPDSETIALTAGTPTTEEKEPRHGLEVGVTWSPRRGNASAARLCLVPLGTRELRCLTDGKSSVHSFDWSPDGRQIAFSASEGAGWDGYMRTDLFVLDVASGQSRPLVRQEGPDHYPVFSPDGRFVAFNTQKGHVDWQQDTTLGVVAVSGGEPTYPVEDFRERCAGTPRGVHWSADSSEIEFEAPCKLTHHLFRVRRTGGGTEQVTPDDDRYRSQFSYARDGSVVAFTSESITEAPEIQVTRLPGFAPQPVTRLNPQLAGVQRAIVERLSWRSKDDRWDVHGVLIKPPDFAPGRKYPLVLFIEGGPQMVRLQYDLGAQYPIQVFAARGYLVLAPNTRGRYGYSYGFDRAIRDEKNYGIGPLNDALAGVERLVAQGIADPDRLGMMGFSYGSYLTEFGITQTSVFKAASAMDGVTDVLFNTYHAAGEPSRARLSRDLLGWDAPFDPAERERIMRQSPIHNVQNARTPILLEYGAESLAPDHGRMFFQALRHFGVPSDFVVYPRTGHGIQEPKLREDSMNRNLDWMDYWVLGKPVPALVQRWPRTAAGPATSSQR